MISGHGVELHFLTILGRRKTKIALRKALPIILLLMVMVLAVRLPLLHVKTGELHLI
jgi:hypothetical protein